MVFANDYQNTQSTSQSSLFGGSVASYIPEPSLPEADEWALIEKLKYEKEVIGIYLTGHPLDNFKIELQRFCKQTVADLKLDPANEEQTRAARKPRSPLTTCVDRAGAQHRRTGI